MKSSKISSFQMPRAIQKQSGFKQYVKKLVPIDAKQIEENQNSGSIDGKNQ